MIESNLNYSFVDCSIIVWSAVIAIWAVAAAVTLLLRRRGRWLAKRKRHASVEKSLRNLAIRDQQIRDGKHKRSLFLPTLAPVEKI